MGDSYFVLFDCLPNRASFKVQIYEETHFETQQVPAQNVQNVKTNTHKLFAKC